MEKKYQIFISSPYRDLKNERQAAVEAILKAGHIPAGMELFSAGSESQLEVIRRWIDESDIYMLILGGRYGSLEPQSGLSYTEIEYDYAVSLGKPLFAVVLTNEAIASKVAVNGIDFTEQYEPRKLDSFRKKVMSRISQLVEDHKDVKLAVLHSIREIENRHTLDGWVRATEGSLVSTISSRKKKIDEADHSPFKLIDSFPANGHSISVDQINQIFLKFNNPIDRKTAVFIATHQFRKNMMQQWTVNGYIQYAENDTKLIWRAHKSVLDQEPPFTPADLEYHRFDILVGHGSPESNVKDIYGNVLPKITIPISINDSVSAPSKQRSQGYDVSFGRDGKCVLPWKKFNALRIFHSNGELLVAGLLDSMPCIAAIDRTGKVKSEFGNLGFIRLDKADISYGINGSDFSVHDIHASENGFLLIPRFDIGTPQKRPVMFDIAGKLVSRDYADHRDYLGVSISGRTPLLSCLRDRSTLFFLDDQGRLDTAFNGTGVLELPMVASQWIKARVCGTRLYVFGNGGDNTTIWRFLNNGTLDLSFGNGGSVNVGQFISFLRLTDVIEQDDGRLIVGGYGNEANLVRLHEDGTIDESFGDKGVVQFRANYRSTCERLIFSQGMLLFAGQESSGNDVHDLFVARLNHDGSADDSFYGEGYFSINVKGKHEFKDMLVNDETITILCQSDVDAPLHNKAAVIRIHQ